MSTATRRNGPPPFRRMLFQLRLRLFKNAVVQGISKDVGDVNAKSLANTKDRSFRHLSD